MHSLLSLVILGILKRPLIGSQSAIRRAEILLEALRDVVECTGVRGEVERCFGLFTVAPEQEIFLLTWLVLGVHFKWYGGLAGLASQ